MIEYIKKILTDLPTDFEEPAVTPVENQIFEVNKDTLKLNEELVEQFHNIVAQLLFLNKRGRPDLFISVFF